MFEPLLAQIKSLHQYAEPDLLAWYRKESKGLIYDQYVYICTILFTALCRLDAQIKINDIITHTETLWLENNNIVKGNTVYSDGASYFAIKMYDINSIEEFKGVNRNEN